MKKLLTFSLILIVFSSCQEDQSFSDLEKQIDDPVVLTDDLVKKQGSNMRQSPSFDWEDLTTEIGVYANSYSTTLPWSRSGQGVLPDFYYNDYKRQDGWEFVYNYTGYKGIAGRDYLIFYNKFSGKLKVLYYLYLPVSNASGFWNFWKISLTKNTGLFNGVGYFTKPINVREDNEFSCSSISTNTQVKAITRHWNGFDVDLVFDPNISDEQISFAISTWDQSITDIQIDGIYLEESEGTIVQTGKNKGDTGFGKFVKSSVKGAGKDAISWLKNGSTTDKNDNSKPIKVSGSALLTSVLTGGVDTFLQAGLNLGFGSWLSKNNPSSQDIHLTTNGEIDLSSTSTGITGNNVSPINAVYFPGTQVTPAVIDLPFYNKKLGVWNLSNAPKVRVPEKMLHGGDNNGMAIYSRRVTLDKNSFSLVFNDDILSEIDHYTVDYDLVYYNEFFDTLNFQFNPSPGSRRVYVAGDLIYKDDRNEIYKNVEEKISMRASRNHPSPLFIKEKIIAKYVVKVTVTIYPNSNYDQTPIVHMRSFLPTYQLY